MKINHKDIDPNNYTQVENYADNVVSGILEASNAKLASCSNCYELVDLFRDHIISMISPNYFNK